MLYLPKPELTLREQVKLDPKSYTFKQFAKDQLDRRQKRYFAADFECTTQEPYTVYMVTIEDIYTHEQWFYNTIDDFLMFCEMHPNSTIYFHNGENYDLEFIINKVLRDDNKWTFHQSRGYSIKKVLNEFEVTQKGTKIKTKKGLPLLLQANIQFRDTTNIFTTSLAELGDSIGIAKGYGYIETPLVAYIYNDNSWCKQTKDYDLIEQTTDFDEFAIKRGWWLYAMQDTHILAEVIRYYNVIEHAEENKHTVAKIAYEELLKTDEVYNNYVQDLKQNIKVNDNFANEMEYLNKFAKQAYRGGLAWTNSALAERKDDEWVMPLFENVLGFHLDYNSMYSSIYMQSDKYPLPTNLPSNKETDLYIIEYTNLRAKCKNGVFPLIKNRTEDINGKPMKTLSSRYYMHTVKEKNIVLTSVEDEYMYKYYEDIEFDSFNIIYYDRHYKLEKALRTFGNKWYNEKVESKKVGNKARTLYSKMMLNSVYGYLGFFNKIVDTYDYILEENGRVDKRIKSSNRKSQAESKQAVLGLPHAEVPAAAFITAYGRVKLAEDINKIGINHVVCIDTDSLFVIGIEYERLKELVDIDPYKLGALDCEHEFAKIISLKPKTWCISDDLEMARKQPAEYAKADPYKPIAQATAGSNYQFKDIRNFYKGNTILVTQKERGLGGIGIVPKIKQLGNIEPDTVDDYNQSIIDSY